ncbi:MAG TPA: DUF4349 domain-containing protein, partial [Nocardioidaceae bacterium]|nr:DUF4349 domain-containing protein [Nocardioidaceae bacterium]
MANSGRLRSRGLWAGVAVVGLVVLSACAGGSGSGEDSSSSGGSQVAQEAGSADAGRAADNAASLASGQASASNVKDSNLGLILDRKLIKTGTISLESKDIDKVLVGIDGIVSAQRGIVESEDAQTDDEGHTKTASVVVRVPVDSFDTALDAIKGLGVLVREQTSTEDVTTKVADVNARVESAQRSIDQLRLLFSRANSLGDIIRLESELSQRQADLESLQAQQRSLGRQTALSTIQVSITRPDQTPTPVANDGDRAGFVDGIKSGWSGLVTFVQATAHVIGLVLPLGMLALIVAVPIWLVVRR